mmetsp:Transcript_14787/g.10689  ORF Transcript_14787/g.10689 Transcript_14787/m.10689 type:complete len:81 (-) Transcript_14787:992-1234(-)
MKVAFSEFFFVFFDCWAESTLLEIFVVQRVLILLQDHMRPPPLLLSLRIDLEHLSALDDVALVGCVHEDAVTIAEQLLSC